MTWFLRASVLFQHRNIGTLTVLHACVCPCMNFKQEQKFVEPDVIQTNMNNMQNMQNMRNYLALLRTAMNLLPCARSATSLSTALEALDWCRHPVLSPIFCGLPLGHHNTMLYNMLYMHDMYNMLNMHDMHDMQNMLICIIWTPPLFICPICAICQIC